MHEKIPAFPVIHVTVQPDGSAHLNFAGRHVDYPARAPEVTRAEVTAYAVAEAKNLGRGVRMTTSDPAGVWKLGVYPNGDVVDLEPVTKKERAAAKTAPVPRLTTLVLPPSTTPPADLPATVAARLPAPARPAVAPPPIPPRPVAAPTPPPVSTAAPQQLVATLTFSTGDSAVVTESAIVGRTVSSPVQYPAGAQLILVDDPSSTLSRVHIDLSWADGTLTVTDRHTHNGTTVNRRGIFTEIPTGKPYTLQHDDVLQLGNLVTCRVSIAPRDEAGE